MRIIRSGIERRIQISGIMVVIGVVIEWITLLWLHPISFTVFILTGALFILPGMLYYLISLIKVEGPS